GGQRLDRGVPGTQEPLAPRTALLLAYLALHAEAPQPRTHLAALFWPDSEEAQARTNLRRELHHLRAVLEDDDSLVAGPTALCWRDRATCRVDVRVLLVEADAAARAARDGDREQVVRHGDVALAACGGELLPGALEEWVLTEREALRRRCVEVCDLLAQTHGQVGDLDRALPPARRRVQLEPLEEAGYLQLIELQAAAGDRSAALATYHRCVSVLERELGVGPGPAVVAAAAALHRERVGGPAGTGRRRAGHRPASGEAPLVGRAEQVRRLERRWDDARHRPGAVTVVSGEAGVGKTRLALEVARRVRDAGGAVAVARCFGRSGRPPLAPVAEWLAAPDLRAAVSSSDAAARREIARLVPPEPTASGEPPVADVDSLSSGVLGRGEGWRRRRFYDGLAQVVLGAGRPTLLVLEDLQWCDIETLSWLTFLVERAERTPGVALHLLVTVRPRELAGQGEHSAWVAALGSEGRAEVVELAPLDVAQVARMGSHLTGRELTAAQAEELHAATGGFPLHVVEAVRSGVGGPPVPRPRAASDPARDALGGVLRRRLGEASPVAREIAGLAACVGRDFDLDLLIGASDHDADVVVDAVDELWHRRILVEIAGGYDFSHDLLREEAYAVVSPPRRWLMHRRLAQSLELAHSGRLDDVAVQLADLYERGGRPERAIEHYVTAAQRAVGLLAMRDAVAHYGSARRLLRALPEGPARDARELDLLFAMSEPLNVAYGYAAPPLVENSERLVDLAGRLGRRRTLIASVVGLWGSRFVQGQHAEALRLARWAFELAETEADLATQGRFALGGSVATAGRSAEAVAHLDRTWADDPDLVSTVVGTRPRVHARAWSAHPCWLLGDDAGARERRDEAVREARRGGRPYDVVVALAYAAVTDQLLGDVDRLRQTADELTELCRRHEVAYYREWALVTGGWAVQGDDGVAAMERGIRRLQQQGALARMPYWLSLLAEGRARVGDAGGARAALDAAQAAAASRQELWWLPEVLRRRSALLTGPRAVEALREAERLAAAHGSLAVRRRCRADLAARGEGPNDDANAEGTPRS
ncbi:MAG TPA: AAA family ATPase, partial [Angustibacter sp.]|nr:AAA family ATPase [Angustibacter sp.]